jgi:hypothetical protein
MVRASTRDRPLARDSDIVLEPSIQGIARDPFSRKACSRKISVQIVVLIEGTQIA